MTLTEDDLKQIRAEIVSAFGKLAESADWYTDGYDDHTESAARTIKDTVRMTVRELIPSEPAPEPCGAPNYSDRCELSSGHEGRHVQGIMSWPAGVERPVTPEPCTHGYRYFGPHSGSRCVHCNEPMPGQTEPDPRYVQSGNPFAPKLTAQQWALMLRTTIDAAQADGWSVWIQSENDFGDSGPRLRIGPPGNPLWENDPIVWEPK